MDTTVKLFYDKEHNAYYSDENLICDCCEGTILDFSIMYFFWNQRSESTHFVYCVGCAQTERPAYFGHVVEVFEVLSTSKIPKNTIQIYKRCPDFVPSRGGYSECKVIDHTHYACREGYSFIGLDDRKQIYHAGEILDPIKQVEVRENIGMLDAPVNDIDQYLLGVKESIPVLTHQKIKVIEQQAKPKLITQQEVM